MAEMQADGIAASDNRTTLQLRAERKPRRGSDADQPPEL